MSNILSVNTLNIKIKSLLEATFMHIVAEGELASVTYHSSGHIYFSIKDDKSSIRCVMWRSSASRLKFTLKKGEKIVVHGSIGVYTPRGEYQFIATNIEPYGKGVLAVAFEQLKQKLEEKGYFDPYIKKPIPKYISKMALVTASNSAGLQDMLKVAKKRWATVEIVIVDVLVQGEYSAGEIARGIRYADSLGVDVIVTGRGGGSTEDLWAFNEEVVADAIYHATTPVVSAVGHEVDSLISDFVADMRAPTPSAAMEMILPDSDELLYMLSDRMEQCRRRVLQYISHKERRYLDLLSEMGRSSVPQKLANMEKEFGTLRDSFASSIKHKLSLCTAQINPQIARQKEIMRHTLQDRANRLLSIEDRFAISNPTKQFKHSWAQINKNGKKIALDSIEIGDEFDIVSEKTKMRVKGLSKADL